jgi:hypothetical protein
MGRNKKSHWLHRWNGFGSQGEQDELALLLVFFGIKLNIKAGVVYNDHVVAAFTNGCVEESYFQHSKDTRLGAHDSTFQLSILTKE